MTTFRSPCVIEAMLRSSCLRGTVTECTVSAVKPSASANAADSPGDRKLHGEFRLARGDIAPGHGLVLKSVHDLVDLVLDSHD